MCIHFLHGFASWTATNFSPLQSLHKVLGVLPVWMHARKEPGKSNNLSEI